MPNFNNDNVYFNDYDDEKSRLSNSQNYNPLLSYILEKNIQNNKKYPVGSTEYYNTYNPYKNPDLQDEFNEYLSTNYPDNTLSFDDMRKDWYTQKMNAQLGNAIYKTLATPYNHDRDYKIKILKEVAEDLINSYE